MCLYVFSRFIQQNSMFGFKLYLQKIINCSSWTCSIPLLNQARVESPKKLSLLSKYSVAILFY